MMPATSDVHGGEAVRATLTPAGGLHCFAAQNLAAKSHRL